MVWLPEHRARLGERGLCAGPWGAYFGGEEVSGIGYGVNHTAFPHGPHEYVPVLRAADLPPDTRTEADAAGISVLLTKQGDQIYALDNTCVHAGCSLSDGGLEGTSIICPCHGSRFDLRDGSVINGPATMPEPRYEVRLRDEMIEVRQAHI